MYMFQCFMSSHLGCLTVMCTGSLSDGEHVLGEMNISSCSPGCMCEAIVVAHYKNPKKIKPTKTTLVHFQAQNYSSLTLMKELG